MEEVAHLPILGKHHGAKLRFIWNSLWHLPYNLLPQVLMNICSMRLMLRGRNYSQCKATEMYGQFDPAAYVRRRRL